MSVVATKKLLFLLADEQDRTYYVEGGVVKKSSLPYWIKHNPDGWKDIALQFATNQKYLSTLIAFSNAVKFVDDGLQIIADRALKGAGTEEIMYLIIMRNDPSQGLNYYKLEYKSRLDFSKFVGDAHVNNISMNTLQDDVFALVQANEGGFYSTPCNATNPAAIKVLFDGILLQDKLNYQLVNVPIVKNALNTCFTIPITFINNEGDNIGTIYNSQTYQNFADINTFIHDPTNQGMLEFDNPTAVSIRGTFAFTWSTNTLPSGTVGIFFATSLDTYPVPQSKFIFENSSLFDPAFQLVPGKTYTIPINRTFNLAAGEKLFLLCILNDNAARNFTIKPLATNLSFVFSTKQVPSVNFGLRFIDLLKQHVLQITRGKFTADSKFFTTNNRWVIFSGSSLRSFADASIQTCFSDMFQSATSKYNLGLTVREGVMWIEPLEDIYNNRKLLMNLGEVRDAKLLVAEQFIFTSGQFGYPKQTYNKRNGRYEYNCIHNVKFPIDTVLNVLNKVSVWRADPFGIEFIRTGYPDLNSTDDKGDNDVFGVMISDEVGSTDGEVSTAVAVTIVTLILAAPIIKTPYTGTTVYNQNPTITGIAQALKLITIYVDGVIDGTTNSDSDGNWSYQVATPLESLSNNFSGVHLIEANAQTDPGNISSFSNLLSLTVNTTVNSAFLITGPTNNDSLYNNLPLIKGIAPAGKAISIFIDGIAVAIAATNSSSLWSYQIVAPLSNGAHIITATTSGLPAAPAVNINVNSDVSSPLITSVQYGDTLFNNLPLIRGVSQAGATVSVYLDGGGGPIVSGTPGPLGTTVADANGDWSFQVTDVYDTGGVNVGYIPDGLHILSTTPSPVDVLAPITGYKLMRGSNKGSIMDYDAIKLDDQYIPAGVDPSSLPPTLGQFLHPETLYNIEETTPLRMQRAHDNLISSFLKQQPGSTIHFNGAEINANLVTKKDGIVFNEGAHVKTNDLRQGFFLPWILEFKTKVDETFNDIMTSINNDGYISLKFKGVDIYVLPLGTMIMKPATDEAQNWKLLVSSKTPLTSLIKIFENGITFNLGKNMLYISDKNPLHFVKYNFTPSAKYHFKDIYDDWQKNRFGRWPLYAPDYKQPWQKTEPLVLQMISNGVGALQIHMIDIASGRIVDTFPMSVVATPLVPLPNQLQELNQSLAAYPSGQYWFAVFADGVYVGIAEKIDLQDDHDDTFLYEYDGSEDKIDFYFSTGIKPSIRVQSQFLVWEPDSEVDIYEDEGGNYEITRGIPINKRILQLGSQRSLIPDWMGRKMNVITLLKNCRYDGVHYTRDANSKWEKEDLGKGIPEMLYKMEVVMAENKNGITFETPGDNGIHTTLYTLDATAFGHNEGVINVTAEETN